MVKTETAFYDQAIRKTLANAGLPTGKMYMVGSRLLGTNRPDSDYDYAMEYDGYSHDFLEGVGFKEILHYEANFGLTDIGTVSVMAAEIVGQKVQVKLVRDLKATLRIMEALARNKPLRDHDAGLKGTPERVYLWNSFYTMAGV